MCFMLRGCRSRWFHCCPCCCCRTKPILHVRVQTACNVLNYDADVAGCGNATLLGLSFNDLLRGVSSAKGPCDVAWLEPAVVLMCNMVAGTYQLFDSSGGSSGTAWTTGDTEAAGLPLLEAPQVPAAPIPAAVPSASAPTSTTAASPTSTTAASPTSTTAASPEVEVAGPPLAPQAAPAQVRGPSPSPSPSPSPTGPLLRLTYNEIFSAGSACSSVGYQCQLPLPPVCIGLRDNVLPSSIVCTGSPMALAVTATGATLDIAFQTGCAYATSNLDLPCGNGVLKGGVLNQWVAAMQGCNATRLGTFARDLCTVVPLPSPSPSATGSTSSSSTPSVSPTISVTPSVTPTISVTPSVTPTISVTPSVTPTISVSPSSTPSAKPPPPAGVIAGAVVGVVCGAAALGLCVWSRRQQRLCFRPKPTPAHQDFNYGVVQDWGAPGAGRVDGGGAWAAPRGATTPGYAAPAYPGPTAYQAAGGTFAGASAPPQTVVSPSAPPLTVVSGSGGGVVEYSGADLLRALKGMQPCNSGGFADVYRTVVGGREVAIKAIRGDTLKAGAVGGTGRGRGEAVGGGGGKRGRDLLSSLSLLCIDLICFALHACLACQEQFSPLTWAAGVGLQRRIPSPFQCSMLSLLPPCPYLPPPPYQSNTPSSPKGAGVLQTRDQHPGLDAAPQHCGVGGLCNRRGVGLPLADVRATLTYLPIYPRGPRAAGVWMFPPASPRPLAACLPAFPHQVPVDEWWRPRCRQGNCPHGPRARQDLCGRG